VDESLIVELEDELVLETPAEPGPVYSERDCERIRLAQTLVSDLGVNIAGVSIILRMRDQIDAMQRQFHHALELIREAATMAERRRSRR
jgi:MerR family transcriptional regulator/heat shock protein HspR